MWKSIIINSITLAFIAIGSNRVQLLIVCLVALRFGIIKKIADKNIRIEFSFSLVKYKIGWFGNHTYTVLRFKFS